jgi:N-acetylated-alpha-linked acidic dipeptidase
MLESVHGFGELLKQGWKPKRTIVICSWDAEEEGLIGSTEWVEAHMAPLARAVAYFNTDVGVSGPDFTASAPPSLKLFVRDVTREVPSPRGGTVYDQWLKSQTEHSSQVDVAMNPHAAAFNGNETGVRIGTLGSGSDFTPFFQHAGVPSTDIGSDGPYGVYHSVFDNYNWFIKNADPTFVYEQQQARVFGLEILHMADTDFLPYDYKLYGTEVVSYLDAAVMRAGGAHMNLDFSAADSAAKRFAAAGVHVSTVQASLTPGSHAALNAALRKAESALLLDAGLPHRPWYRHVIYDPGEFTGYAAVVIPGVNEGIDANDAPRTQAQIAALAAALNRSAVILEAVTK